MHVFLGHPGFDSLYNTLNEIMSCSHIRKCCIETIADFAINQKIKIGPYDEYYSAFDLSQTCNDEIII